MFQSLKCAVIVVYKLYQILLDNIPYIGDRSVASINPNQCAVPYPNTVIFMQCVCIKD